LKLADPLRSMFYALFRSSDVSEDIEEELRSHIAHRADDLVRSGVPRAEAERRARIEFGARGRYRDESYEALGGNFLETLGQDIRFAIRVLRKSRGFALAAILTLAMAIGANAVVFGVMNALILRPLNVPQADSLYGTEYGDGAGWQAYPNYRDLRDRNRSFEDLAAFRFAFVGIDTGGDPVAGSGFATTGNYFDVLRIRPALGRLYHAADERGPNSAPYVVLSHAYWHSRFQEDPGVVGRQIRINKHPFTVIGVAQAGFQGTLMFVAPDFFLPLVNQEQIDGAYILDDRANNGAIFEVFGHLKPGVTPQQAIADMNVIGSELEKAYPKEFLAAFPGHKGCVLSRPGLTSFRGAAQAFVAGLMVLAGLILLAACANLGSLFAAHAADRSREVALRLALGSTRQRILRQLLTEAGIIALAGGAAGLFGSVFLLRKLSTWQPIASVPLHIPADPDYRVYVVALALALVSGFLFGIVPVRQVLRTNPYEVVKAGSGGVPAGLGRRVTARDLLLVLQIAVCAVLITSSIVAVRGLMRSMQSNLGFEPQGAMVIGANLAQAGYRGDQVQALEKRFVDELRTVPGVEAVGMVYRYPPLVYAAGERSNVFKDETRDFRQSNVAALPYHGEVSPGYFQAAGTPLLAGRGFEWRDDRGATPVAVVNREFARRMFGSANNAVGRFYRRRDGVRVQIAGVVEDGKYLSLTENSEPAVFVPFLQAEPDSGYLIVRSHRDPVELAAVLRQKMRSLDEGLPLDIQPWSTMLETVLFPSRMATMALGVLGLMGAMLSITGIFGMAAYSVSRRIRELGIRMALGARRSAVLKAALGRPVRLLAFGSASGLILGILATKVLSSIVYQATPRDPIVLAGAVLAMSLLGLLATWIPAQRALSVNPLILLREE